MNSDKRDKYGWLCFLLGIFGPIGLVIAAIVDKGRGVCRALLGMVVVHAALFLIFYGMDRGWYDGLFDLFK